MKKCITLMAIIGCTAIYAQVQNKPFEQKNQDNHNKNIEQYEEGYRAGFRIGYCDGEGVECNAPIAPAVPLPSVNVELSYRQGLRNGKEEGKMARREIRRSNSKSVASKSLTTTDKLDN